MSNWEFESEIIFTGYPVTDYPGAFQSNVEKIIKNTIGNSNNVLHLFSGSSKIGNTRIDLNRHEATINMDVFEFIKSKDAQRHWEWCLLDPPYNIHNAKNDLKGYGETASVSASIPKRNALAKFFREYCKNVLWLDFCAPLPYGFRRKKIWFCFPGGYITIRILSWLKREQRLDEVMHNR